MNEREKMALYNDVFTSDNGSAVLDDLVEAFFDVVPYEPGSKQDVNDTVFYEGCRHVIAHILYMTDPENAHEMDNVDGGQYI